MEYWIFLFLELFIIFLTSRFLFNATFASLYLLTKSKKVSMAIVAVIFFPGVFIHEAAHAITAGVLFVKIKKIEFLPEFYGSELKLGSVEVGKSDAVRQFIIGIAPFIVGIVLVLILASFARDFSLFSFFSSPIVVLRFLGLSYAIFVITNTMFSSKKDREGGVWVLIGGILVLGGMYFIWSEVLRSVVSFLLSNNVVGEIKNVAFLFLFPLVLNVLFTGILRFSLRKRIQF